MQITGIIKLKGETVNVSEKFSKREFVLTDNSSQYPQHISMQATQDRCSILDGVNVGDEVTAYINIRGREWSSPQGEIKYFNTIECYKCDVKNKATHYEPVNSQERVAKDDLPF